ncbi:MAG: polysaccharide pyruvyl transferase family protein [Campylobacterota bacterium]|nr:polysaccharide pyruvyl transferase family protein [Campylobacterota bacterium]
MKTEVIGAGFVNKGAELMVHAIYQQINDNLPNSRLVLPANNNCPYEKRAYFNAFQKISLKRYGLDIGHYLQALLPKLLKRQLGLIDDNDIDVVLDASGFAYSDQWGVKDTLVTANYFEKLKKDKDVKVILLPQAFGPFTSEGIKKAFQKLIDNSDLVFPRDDISYKYVTELVGKQEKIIQAPDFTNLLHGKKPENFQRYEGKICITPNYRMLDKTSSSDKYVPFMSFCINELLSRGEELFFLIHEGDKDLWLAEEINKSCNSTLGIIHESDPLVIKGLIKECKGVVGSRFHGLVSALSQGVPTLAVGWSHKYDMLFKDYNFPEGSLSMEMSKEDLSQILTVLTDQDRLDSLKETLSIASKEQKELSKQMWAQVFTCIGKD